MTEYAMPVLRCVPIQNPHVEIYWCQDGSGRHAIFKHGPARRYFRMSQARTAVWQLCDGLRSGFEIASAIRRAGGPNDLALIADVLTRFSQNDLIKLGTLPVSVPNPRRTIFQTCLAILTVRIDFPNADRLATRLYAAIGHIIMTKASAGAIIAIAAVGFLASFWNARGLFSPGAHSNPNYWVLALTGFCACSAMKFRI